MPSIAPGNEPNSVHTINWPESDTQLKISACKHKGPEVVNNIEDMTHDELITVSPAHCPEPSPYPQLGDPTLYTQLLWADAK